MSMRLNSNSDTTQSIDIAQVTGILDSIPPLPEDESLLLQHNQNPLKQRQNSEIDSQTIEEDCVDLDFSPEWEANFSGNNAVKDELLLSHSWEGIVTSVGANDETQLEIDSIACKSTDNHSQTSSLSNKGNSASSSTTSSCAFCIKKGFKGQPTRIFAKKIPKLQLILKAAIPTQSNYQAYFFNHR